MRILGYGLVVLLLVACGGGDKEPVVPPPPPEDPSEASDPTWVTDDSTPADEPDPVEARPNEEEEKALTAPEFTPGMTVNQAISAVPSHYDYVGIDQEVLAKPLMDIDTYKECNVTPNEHFQVKIAVWNGKVVGADVKAATPAKKECIDRVVRGLEYNDQVESINTVEYSF